MSRPVTIRSSQTLNRDMMVTDDNGNSVQIAMVSGSVQPGRSLSISVTIINPEIADECEGDIMAWLDAFITEVRGLASASGIPV